MVKEYQKGVRTKLSDYFYSTEFDCHCNDPDCKVTKINPDLIAYLENKRIYFGKKIIINSGYRCLAYNRSPAVGSNNFSQHPKGNAADISFEDENITDHSANFQDADGLGIYKSKRCLHVDKRGYKARWIG